MRSLRSFRQALGYCWPYRGRIVASWLCGLVAAVCWAGSISTILPVFNLLFRSRPEGLHIVERRTDDPDRPERVLEADRSWKIIEDPSIASLQVRGRTVRVPPDVRVERPEGALEELASRSEAEGDLYAPALRLLANVLPADRMRALIWVLGFMLGLVVLRGVMDYGYEYLVGHATARAALAIRVRVFDHVLRSRLTLLSRTSPSDIMSRFNQDLFHVMEGMKSVLGKTVVMPPRALFCLAAAIVIGAGIDLRLVATVLVAVPLVAVLIRRFARRMRRASRKALQSQAAVMGRLEESLFGIRVVKGYHLEGHQRRRFFGASRRLFANWLRGIRIQAATGPVVETLFTIAAVGAVIVGASVVLEEFEPAKLGELTTFFAFLVGGMDPIRKLSNVSNRVQQAAAGADRVFELMEADLEPRYGAAGKILPRHRDRVEFENVSFAYPAGGGEAREPALRHVSLSVPHGEVLAVVGRTGCGKTTLVSLVPRFFEPDEGRVLVDGTDIADVTLRSLREQIAIVPQETILFADTVAANIAVGRPGRGTDVEREAIESAARMARADTFIRGLPEGYDTVLEEHGSGLSGGERQRIALARAIIRDPAILILDEATSALDEETQGQIQEALREFSRGRTTFLIAHRLSTLSIADRIAVMDRGRIVDVGTHEELLEACELYRRLCEIGLDGV